MKFDQEGRRLAAGQASRKFLAIAARSDILVLFQQRASRGRVLTARLQHARAAPLGREGQAEWTETEGDKA